MASPSFDPTSPEYQLSDQYKPDKEATWHFPAEKDGWVQAHNSIRQELQDLRQVFEALQQRQQELREWEIKAIKTAANGHLEHIHAHHTNEDEILVPELRKRFKFPEKLVTDHVHLVKLLDEVNKRINDLKAGDKIDHVLEAFLEYEQAMRPHLLEEEERGLPLYRAYFTPKEGEKIIQKIIARSPRFETGSIVRTMGVEKFRKEFMPQEGIPPFVWFLVFKPKYKVFMREFVANVEALKSGQEPPPSAACGGCAIM